MSRRSWLFVAGGVALAVAGSCAVGFVFLLGVAIAPKVREHMPSPSPTVDTDAFRQAMARAHAGVPEPSGLAPRECPDAEILAAAKASVHTGNHGEARLAIPQVSYESLGVYAKDGPTPYQGPFRPPRPTREDLGFDPVPGTGPEDWRWLDDFGLRCVFHPNLDESRDKAWSAQQTIHDVQGRRYLAVVRADTRRLPRVSQKGEAQQWTTRRVLLSGKSFEPGVFKGAVAVMDLETSQPVCQATLDVKNSDSLTYTTRGPLQRRPSDVVAGDFQEHFRDAVRQALEGISSVVQAR